MMKMFSVVLVVLLSCSTKSNVKTTTQISSVCNNDINSVLETFESHLCFLYQLYDEECPNNTSSDQSYIRVMIWDDRKSNEITKLENLNGCYLLTQKTIPPHQFNAFGIIVEKTQISYSVSKWIVAERNMIGLSQEIKTHFSAEQRDYESKLFLIEVSIAGDYSKYYQEDSLNVQQLHVLEQLYAQ